MTEIRTAAILFGGIGGFSAGLKRSIVEAYGKVYKWKILCSIDFDCRKQTNNRWGCINMTAPRILHYPGSKCFGSTLSLRNIAEGN